MKKKTEYVSPYRLVRELTKIAFQSGMDCSADSKEALEEAVKELDKAISRDKRLIRKLKQGG